MSKKTFMIHYHDAFAKERDSMRGIDLSAIAAEPKKRTSKTPFVLGASLAAALAIVLLGPRLFEDKSGQSVSEDFKSETYAMLVNLETNYEFDSWTLWSE